MKRLITIILAMVMIVPATSLADLPDISKLTREELEELNRIVQDALFEQTLPEGVLVPAGDYVVGIDIPAGDYRADVVSDVGGIIRVYPSKEEYEKSSLSYITETNLGNMWGTLVFHLVLEEGNFVMLKYNSLKLYKYAGLIDMSIPKD